MSESRAYLPKRMVYVNGDIGSTMESARRELMRLLEDDKDKPILLIITSYGGYLGGLSALADRIHWLRGSGAKIDCMIEGYAMSAALILAQCCDHRMAGPGAILMFHGATWGDSGDEKTHDGELALTRHQHDQIAGLFGERTHKSASYWRRLLRSNRPRYYSASEALELGLLDEVI